MLRHDLVYVSGPVLVVLNGLQMLQNIQEKARQRQQLDTTKENGER